MIESLGKGGHDNVTYIRIVDTTITKDQKKSLPKLVIKIFLEISFNLYIFYTKFNQIIDKCLQKNSNINSKKIGNKRKTNIGN